ncbi:MAG TPA: ROK family protein [Anaerolineales bacterium]|nr:ROK family protein [Anaerolineales bacterium]
MVDGKLYGAMEGGGTKFVCAVGNGPEDIREEIRFPTTGPDETIEKAIAFFKKHKPAAIGLAPFGPLDLHPSSPSYGSITATPKAGWSNTDILGRFRRAFDLPLAFDLDVNAAAFGEYSWLQENRNLDSLVYYTIGTGIGAGLVIGGKLVHGLTHPEAGHMHLPHDLQKDPFPGSCPFHRDCFEGLANGPAIGKRWGQSGDSLPDEHPAWDLEATYIAHALVSTITLLSPQRIVLGGGVMERLQLFPMIRCKVKEILNGYIPSPLFEGTLDGYIVPPGLGKRSGILGAMALAKTLEI